MGGVEAQLHEWKRGRHAKRCTILRICSGANLLDESEASGIGTTINDDTTPTSMTKFRGQGNGRKEVHCYEGEGGIRWYRLQCLAGRTKYEDEGNFKRIGKHDGCRLSTIIIVSCYFACSSFRLCVPRAWLAAFGPIPPYLGNSFLPHP